MIFDNDNLAVLPDSQLDTLFQLNPAVCIQFAAALLKELEDTMATCTIDSPTASPVDSFEQIHALKNMISSTGCRALLDACATLQFRSDSGTHRTELRSAFNEITQATQHLIAAYHRRLTSPRPE